MRSFSCFKPKDRFKLWSRELDKKVALWAKDFDSSFKLLLLGSAGAGKTTVLKQIKIIHSEGFSIEERKQKAKEIRTNLLESVRELTACIVASGKEICWEDEANKMKLEFINNLYLDDQTYELYAAKIYDYSKRILNDKGVREIFEQLNQLSITHRSQYLLSRVDEIRNSNYLPNNDDILHSRRRTSDIQKLEFKVDFPTSKSGHIEQTFCMLDVGGQRGERRKWIQVFDGVSAVMFLIDSSSFDTIDDDSGQNRLRESLELFNEVWSTRFLLNSNFVLLFNKQDILKEKIERGIRFEQYFPEFNDFKTRKREKALLTKAGEKLNLFRSSKRTSRLSSLAYDWNVGFGSASDNQSVNKSVSLDRKSKSQSMYDSLNPSAIPSTTSKHSTKQLTQSSSFQETSRIETMRNQSSSESSIRKSAYNNSNQTDIDFYETNNTCCESKGSSRDSSRSSSSSSTTTNNGSSDSPRSSIKNYNTYRIHKEDSTQECKQASKECRKYNQQKDESKKASSKGLISHQETYLRVRSFIKEMFIQVTKKTDLNSRKYTVPNINVHNSSRCNVDQPKRIVCYHYTTATDTENVRELFIDLQKMMIKSSKNKT